LICEKNMAPGNHEHRAKNRPEDHHPLLIAWL
jgi:hypothetical protein